MSQSIKQIILSLGFKSTSDMSAGSGGPGPNTSYQYTFVKLSGTTFGNVDKSGAGDPCFGICNNQPKAASAAEVAIQGVSQLIVDGSGTAIAVGDRLKSDASGRGVKSATNLDNYGAVALEASSAAGDQIAVLIVSMGQQSHS